MSAFKDAFRFIVFSNYWISIAAACYGYLTVIQLGLDVPVTFYWFLFTATLCSYCLQRFVQLPARKEKHSERQDFLVGNRMYLGLTTILSGLASAVLAFEVLSINQILWLIPVGLISLLYSVKFLGKKKGLRDLPGVKIFMIAISWSFLCGFLPIWIGGLDQLGTMELFAILSEKTLFIFAITIPFDVRDLKYDDPSKRTIPQILGVSKAMRLSIVILVLAAGASFFSGYDPKSLTGLMLSFAITLWALLSIRKESKELMYSGLLDGTIIIQLVTTIGCIWWL